MLSFLAGTDLEITVPIANGGEPFVPDSTGLSWYLRDQAGNAGGSTNLATVTNTQVTITVPAASNALPTNQRFSKRFLCLTGTVAGSTFTIVTPYQLRPWINSTVTKDDVRNFIGVDKGEVSDDTIDLVEAYFEAVDSVGFQALLDTALSSGTVSETNANHAILMKAVMGIVLTLQLRLSQSESDGSMSVSRLGTIDLDSIYKLASISYAEVITALTGRVVFQRQAFLVTIPTDVITGK